MKNFWRKYKTYLTILIYLVVVASVGFFIARSMVLAIRGKNDQIQQKIALQEGKEAKMKELPLIRSQFEEVKNQEEKIDISLNKDNVVTLVENLEKVSEETGNKIKLDLSENTPNDANNNSSKSKSKNPETGIIQDLPNDNYVKMKINLYGSYDNFLDFLSKIENSEFYSDVTSVAIKRAAEGGTGIVGNPFVADSSLSQGENNLADKDKINSNLEVVFYLKNE